MLCVDLIGPYKIPLKRNNPLKLWCLVMNYPATGWFGMAQIPNETAAEIANITEKTWFTRYPLPQKILFDRGTEFMAEFSKMYQNDYGLKRKHITTINPQSNAIIERIHQTIGNIIGTFDVSNIVNNNPWSGILFATMFAVRATYHTTLQESPMQLVFFRDTILNIKYFSKWEHIRQRKELRINHNKKRENLRLNIHQYNVDDKILVNRRKNFNHKL